MNLSTVVATVNNSQITIGHVIAVKKQLPDQYQKLGYDVLFKGILDQLVQQEILASSFKYDPTWISILLENERRNILSSIILEKISKAAVTKGALKNFFDTRKNIRCWVNIDSERGRRILDGKSQASQICDTYTCL